MKAAEKLEVVAQADGVVNQGGQDVVHHLKQREKGLTYVYICQDKYVLHLETKD